MSARIQSRWMQNCWAVACAAVLIATFPVRVNAVEPAVRPLADLILDFRELVSHPCDTNDDCRPGQYCRSDNGDCDGDGHCVRRPRACPAVYQPVCGCDGTTYGNKCEAAAEGVNVAYAGECEPPCCDPADAPGQNGIPACFEGASCCADGSWACNDADGTPSCDLGEVCEVIGKCCLEGGDCINTTEEDCYNQCGGFGGAGTACGGVPWDCPIPPIIIAACCLPDGSCEVTTPCRCERQGGTPANTVDCAITTCSGVEVCGGIAGIPCSDPNDFCRLNEGECCCDFQGVCTPIPDVCPLFFDPVCGCDGNTYSNECLANAAGVSVDHHGHCGTGCTNNADCASPSAVPGLVGNHYCHKSPGNCNGTGECAPRPQACYDLWAPVCGCDGATYGNDCEAAAAGVSIAHFGPCAGEGEVCGGFAGIPCSSAADFCKTNEGECCCDFHGVCTPRPEVCPLYYDPVCGCDGSTYGNECESDAAGVSVDHQGACGNDH